VPFPTRAQVAAQHAGEVTAILAEVPAPGPGGLIYDDDYDRLIQALKDWAGKLKRRDLLAVLGAAATAAYAAAPGTQALPGAPRRTMLAALGEGPADEPVVAHMTAILRHLRLQEDFLGPQVVLRTALAQLDVTRSLLAGNPPPHIRPQLLSLLAGIARFSGWLLFDLNDFKGADHYYGLARSAAHEANDYATCSMVLANWSLLATWAGDPWLGVEHSLGAIAWGQRADSPLLVAWGCDRGARAYSRLAARSGNGQADRTRCLASLDQAQQELSAVQADDPGMSLAYFYTSSAVQAHNRAECLVALGEPEPALALTRQSLAAIDPAFVRDMAFTHVYAARAHLQMTDVDAACAQLTDAVTLAAGNSSARLSGMITGTRRSLTPWQDSRAVAALDAHMRELTA
jgi:tetratricopeptide (TPR) repeat protein